MEQSISPYLKRLIADGFSNKFLLEEGILHCPAYPGRRYKITEVSIKVFPDSIFQVTIYAIITPDRLMGTFVLPWEAAFEEY